ncbi:MAG: geranylgeranyl reductase family protein [Thermodesulfobacteriota bacterium]|nr:geranylgeranyl reductase family protein [Thermodesulfobacteriota bacterium]
METNYDVIISGGGPAGAAAGRVLAGNGLSVLIIDKSEFPRPKLCGGLLTHKTVRAVSRIFGESAETLKQRGIIDHESSLFSVHYLDKPLCKGKSRFPFYFVRRETFDHFLLGLAVRAGVKTLLGHKVESCDPKSGQVRTVSGERFSGRFVLGADGVFSAVRKSFPSAQADKTAWRENLATAVEAAIEPKRLSGSAPYPRIFLGVVNAGYGWVFPNSNRFLVGLCGLNRSNKDFKARLYDFSRFLGVLEPEEISFRGHPLPYGNFITRPVFKNALLAGDAAGFVEPILGEGVYYALVSGSLAARSILERLKNGADPARTYARLLGRDVYTELIYSRRLRALLYACQRRINPKWPAEFLLRLCASRLVDLVHGTRSFKWLKKREM